MTIVTRFAPSPTGDLHLGGARTALFNYAFARANGGRFLLRIEDTDAERNTEASRKGILEAMRWLGLAWDGDVIMQSERIDHHRSALNLLAMRGRAYRAFETPDELAALREAGGKTWTYDGPSRSMSAADAKARADRGDAHVWRLRTPDTGDVTIRDKIRGEVSFPLSTISDPVIWRSSSDTPLYNFACAVDDMTDAVTHVIRGEEHLGNAGIQTMIRKAFSEEFGDFLRSAKEDVTWAHLPIVTRNGRKMSKRDPVTETDGPVGVLGRRDEGWNPEPLLNHLALLGWSRPDSTSPETFTLDEFVSEFDLGRVRKSPSNFDEKKARKVQKIWMSMIPSGEIARRARDLGATFVTAEAAEIASAKSPDLRSLISMLGFVETMPVLSDDDLKSVTLPADGIEAAAAAIASGNVGSWEDVTAIFPGHEPRSVALAVRIGLTGSRVSPDLMSCVSLLGEEEASQRLMSLAEAMRKIEATPGFSP